LRKEQIAAFHIQTGLFSILQQIPDQPGFSGQTAQSTAASSAAGGEFPSVVIAVENA
jgi:hypothetical protein